MDRIEPAEETRWRLDSPGKPDWAHEVRPGENKYFMISVDSHLMPNMREFAARLERKYHAQMPRVETRPDAQRSLVVPGMRPERILQTDFAGDDLARSEAGGD